MADENPPTRREQKADAAAEKARSKASRPWYKKKRFIIPLGLVLLFTFAGVVSGGGEDTATPANDEREQEAQEQQEEAESGLEEPDTTAEEVESGEDVETAGIGEPVDDGKFRFTVHGIECGSTRVGGPDFGHDAQGQFCFLDVTVENVGNESQFLFADNQYLFDGQDRRFSADSEAAIYMDESDTLFSEINPGNSIQGRIPFDIPADTNVVKARLHDSAFSGGVEVPLS